MNLCFTLKTVSQIRIANKTERKIETKIFKKLFIEVKNFIDDKNNKLFLINLQNANERLLGYFNSSELLGSSFSFFLLFQ